MKVPTVHLNGTSKQSLLEDLQKAHTALYEAMLALSNAAPNGRDYYVQGPRAIDEAVNEHSQRIAKVQAVRFEIEQLMEAIDQQGRRT